MKPWFLSLLFLLLMPALAFGADNCTSSGLLTGSAVIATKPAFLCGMEVLTDGTNLATAIAYDNASAYSGTVLLQVPVPGASYLGGLPPIASVPAVNGITVSLSVAGSGTASFVVWYRLR